MNEARGVERRRRRSTASRPRALAVVPFAFLVGLLRRRVAPAAAVNERVARLGAGRRHGALRDTLGDPTLRVAYWLPERGEWVDAEGVDLALPAKDRNHRCVPVEHDGEPVALLVHTASVG
jgi:hypothetical protein